MPALLNNPAHWHVRAALVARCMLEFVGGCSLALTFAILVIVLWTLWAVPCMLIASRSPWRPHRRC